jgi:hypothetical protein
MKYLVPIAGVALFSLGAWIIALYWVYYLRVLAMKCGWGSVKFSSMQPLAGPTLVILGAFLFGQPLNKIVGFWVFLVDLNTYVMVVSLLTLFWPKKLFTIFLAALTPNTRRSMTDTMQPNAKILFRISNDDGAAEVETLWATKLEGDNYQFDNSPFYAYGVSWQDIVFSPYDQDEEFPTFQHVVSKSGHRTIRIIFDPPVEDGNPSDQVLQGVIALGCTYEGENRGYMSIDIPPHVELETVRNYLIERDANWEHADPTYDALFPNKA